MKIERLNIKLSNWRYYTIDVKIDNSIWNYSWNWVIDNQVRLNVWNIAVYES